MFIQFKPPMLILFAVIMAIRGTSGFCGDEKMEAMLKAPYGVFGVEKDENGHLIRLKIKGEADVPTSMRGSRADRYALEKASRNAKANFTKYLSESIVFNENETGDVTLVEKNGTETSDVLIQSKDIYTSTASALISGLTVLLNHVEGEDTKRLAICVLGWSRKSSEAAKTAKVDMEAHPQAREPASGTIQTREATKPKGNTQTITQIGDLDNF
jgi:hypothetical protein